MLLHDIGHGPNPRQRMSTPGLYVMAVLFVALAACQTVAPGGQPLAPSAAGAAASPDDGIMLVFYRELSFVAGVDDIANEALIIECAGETIRRNRPQQRIVSFDTFRRTAFPDLSPESAPRNPKYLSMLLQRDDFQDRIRPLGIRHIAFIGGVTETETKGGIGCLGAGPGWGCFGLITWDHESRLGASVLDLNDPRREEHLDASASGTSWFAMALIFPAGFPSDTVGAACRDLGRQLTAYLDGHRNREIPPRN